MKTKEESGQTTVEFAIALPALIGLIMLLAGTAQITYHWVVMQYAATEAARYGSLGKKDPGSTREDSIRLRVNQITHGMGVDDVQIEFIDHLTGSSAGASSEFFTLRLTRDLDLPPPYGVLLSFLGGGNGTSPSYQLIVRTVIRNEPF